MNFIDGIFSNKSIIIPTITWMIAQFTKVILVIIKEKKINYQRFIGSGGMPSAHSSFIVCLTTIIGKNDGWNSHLFGISFAFSLIVMYDATGVRRAAGKQAEVLNKIMFSFNNIEGKLKELLGHSPFEVIVGAILGIMMGMLFG